MAKICKEFLKRLAFNNWFNVDINKQYSREELVSAIKMLAPYRWHSIIRSYALSENFIREFSDVIEWNGISKYQTLSEDFIREFQDKVNWGIISQVQELSEDFIREFQDKVNWYYIGAYQHLSKEFKKEFEHRLTYKEADFNKNMYNLMSNGYTNTISNYYQQSLDSQQIQNSYLTYYLNSNNPWTTTTATTAAAGSTYYETAYNNITITTQYA